MDDLIDSFARTTEGIVNLEEFRKKLRGGRRLKIKFGADLTAPFLHLGHAVNLWMMREMQERGHKVQFLIGDFTTRIGDPTGRAEGRRLVAEEEMERNAAEFLRQVSKVLITDDPDVFEARRNSEWFGKMDAAGLLGILAEATHAKLVSRDMFQKRIAEGKEIRMHEMVYPLLQGFDSAMLESDLTIVGSDQLFNEMMGRHFQERAGQEPQVVITTKITPGLDGVQKQSKSLNNFIAIGDGPRDKFGKAMSLPDRLVPEWLEVYTKAPMDRIAAARDSLAAGGNPRDDKLFLARSLVERWHGAAAASAEEAWFRETFSRGAFPADAPSIAFPEGKAGALDIVARMLPGRSRSECRRLILEGGFELDGRRVERPEEEISLAPGKALRARAGRRGFAILEGE